MLAKLFDFAPALAFFFTYRFTSDIISATVALIACSALSFGIQYLLWRKISRIQIFMLVTLLCFSVPTILLNDPDIIKLKATFVNLVLSLMLFVTQFIMKRNPLSYLIGEHLPLPDYIWLKIGYFFMFFFIFAAGLNAFIAFCLPDVFGIDPKYAESLWVDYKTFGSTILNCTVTAAFMIRLYYVHPELKECFVESASELKKRRDNR